MRGALLFILVLGLLGTGTELVLLEHYVDPWQLAPLVLIGLALACVLWYGVTRRPASLVALQILMVFFIAGGLLGIWLHYNSNVEFEREMDPSLAGVALFRKSLSGAMPALAPGTMIQLGLIGLVYTWRHPRAQHPASAERLREGGPERLREGGPYEM